MLGFYKSERGESGGTARAVPLRDNDTYSVLLARFVNEALGETISLAQTMQSFRNAYPLDTREADANIAAAGEYTAMLLRLRTDDLPRFEGRFKELLNENTIREVAGFQSQLARERHDIKERIETIEWTDLDHRQLGQNRVPAGIVVLTREDALQRALAALIG